MARCRVCGFESIEIPRYISLCRDCILKDFKDEYLGIHGSWRGSIGLKQYPNSSGDGVRCIFCVNECSIEPGESGYCGVILNRDGILTHISGDLDKAVLYYYLDPIPTNCVAAHVCPASNRVGYPKYSVSEDVEHGYYNLAVFFGGCNIDCLFCQNIEHKYMVVDPRYRSYVDVKELFKMALNDKVTCICFFGGDPTPHTIYTLKFSKKIIELSRKAGIIKRLCWETNGLENPLLFKKMVKYSYDSGGIIKIDWKAYYPEIYSVLTGIDGFKALKRIKENVDYALSIDYSDRGYPLLTISTLVIPHYISYDDIYGIASYIAERDVDTPYILLAFAPHHLMRDGVTTSYRHMMECVDAARDAGLRNVFIGNYWLLR